MLPTDVQNRLEEAPLHRVIADYLAGMTDRYALDEWNKLFDPYSRAWWARKRKDCERWDRSKMQILRRQEAEKQNC